MKWIQFAVSNIMRFIKYGCQHQVTIVWTIKSKQYMKITSDKHIVYNQPRIYYVLLKSTVSIKNKKSIFIVNADFIFLICFWRCIPVHQLMHSRNTSMFLDIQHVYLHQRLLIWQIQVCTIYTSSHVETTTSGMYHVYVIICLNDNFRYVPCLLHRLLI